MADYDLLTLEEAKRAVNVSSSVDTLDDAISDANTDVARTVVKLCGPVVAETVTAARLPVIGGKVTFAGSPTPVLSLTTIGERYAGVTTSLTVEDDDTFPTAGVLLDGSGHHPFLRRRSGGVTVTWTAGYDVIATYQAGRCTSTETVPYEFKAAARSILARYYRQTAGQWARSQNLPDADDVDDGGWLSLEDMVRSALQSELTPDGLGVGVA